MSMKENLFKNFVPKSKQKRGFVHTLVSVNKGDPIKYLMSKKIIHCFSKKVPLKHRILLRE